MLLLQNMLLKILLESHRFFFLYATTIKNIFSKVCLLFVFKFWQCFSFFFQKPKSADFPALGFTLQTYKIKRSIGLRIRVIEFIFFCIGVAILPANIVESTIRAMVTPHDWQGIEGDSFWGVGVMINGIECKGRQCAAWWNRHHRGQDES